MVRSCLFAVVAALIVAAGCASAGVGGAVDASGDATSQRDAAASDAASDAPSDAANVCASAATCTGALVLGTVSGDTNNQKLSTSGYQAAWIRVRVTEDNSSALGLTLRVAAKLTSPSGANFDAFVYVNTGSDTVECTTTTGTLTTTGNVEQTRAEWGEGTIANGADDGRDVSIEVRPVSGTCAPGQTWQLEIEGNWL